MRTDSFFLEVPVSVLAPFILLSSIPAFQRTLLSARLYCLLYRLVQLPAYPSSCLPSLLVLLTLASYATILLAQRPSLALHT